MSDGLFVTKVHLSDAKSHHLLTVVKKEPQDHVPVQECSVSIPSNREGVGTSNSHSYIPSLLSQPPRNSTPGGITLPISAPPSYSTVTGSFGSRLPVGFLSAVGGQIADGMQSMSSRPRLSSIHMPVVPSVSSLPCMAPRLVPNLFPAHCVRPPLDFVSRAMLPSLVNSVNVSATPRMRDAAPVMPAYLVRPNLPQHTLPPFFHSNPKTSAFGQFSSGLQNTSAIGGINPMSTMSGVTAAAAAAAAAALIGVPNRPRVTVLSDIPTPFNQFSDSHGFTGGAAAPPHCTPTTLSLSVPVAPHNMVGIQPQIYLTPSLITSSTAPVVGTAAPRDTSSLNCVVAFNMTSTQSDVPLPSTSAVQPQSFRVVLTDAPSVATISTAPTTSAIASRHITPTTTKSLVPQANPIAADYAIATTSDPVLPMEAVTDFLNSNSVIWGRAVRVAEGDLYFPGLGRQFFSSPLSVLSRVLTAISSDDNLSLQLPPSALDFELPKEARANNWFSQTSSSCGSRKGFHVCLCCQQSFTSQSLFDSHMLRPVARIFYRCHLCRGSETAHITCTTSSTTTDNTGDDTGTLQPGHSDCTRTASGCVGVHASHTHSPYCVVLFGGIVKSSNRCAIYSHFALAHPNQVDEWKLQPSLLSVCPLSDSAWNSLYTDGRSSVPPGMIADGATRADSAEIKDQSVSKSNELAGGHVDVCRVVDKVDHSMFYRTGMELVGIWRELERAVNVAVAHQDLSFLNQPIHTTNLGRVTALSETHLPPVSSDIQRLTWADSSPLQRLICSSSTSNPGLPPPLPVPDSSFTQTILHYARADMWHSHLFLTDWCQRYLTPGNGLCTTDTDFPLDLVVIEDGLEGNECTSDLDADIVEPSKRSPLPYVVPPPAPQRQELIDAFTALSSLRYTRPQNVFGVGTDQCSTKLSASFACPMTNEMSNSVVPGVATARDNCGLLRCLLCSFRTNDSQQLVEHLSGVRPVISTKCALCAQSVCVRQPYLCSVKAHLLLHLGYFVMCPECGFTPPPFLPPDAAELCLRIHLRFVCFHFNLLQVYVCTQCHGRGKAFNTLNHLCQHLLDVHLKRAYFCLWCARMTNTGDNTGDRLIPPITEPASGNRTESTVINHLLTDTSDHDKTATCDTRNPAYSTSKNTKCFLTSTELLAHMHNTHRHILSFPITTNASRTNFGQVDLATKDNGYPSNASSDYSTAGSTRSLNHMEDSTHSDNFSFSSNPSDSVGQEKFISPLVHLVPAVDFSCGYLCSQCNDVFDRREAFSDHFRTAHSTGHLKVNCYRCFGSCKRLSFDLEEFHQHLTSCPMANEVYTATFGLCRSSAAIKRQTLDRARSSSSSERAECVDVEHTNQCIRDNGLCFCFHCGIGARRSSVSTRSVGGNVDPDVGDPQPSEHSEDASNLNCPVLAEVSPNHSTSSIPIPVLVPTETCAPGHKEPTSYSACYFPDLQSLHAHEDQFHFVPNSSTIICPWCGRRLSCLQRADIRTTVMHLRSHLKTNAFAAWYLDRQSKWNTKAWDLPYCFCGAALLDSPLAIISHASTHLTVPHHLMLSSYHGVRTYESPHTDRPIETSTLTSQSHFPSASVDRGRSNGTIVESSVLQDPGPGAHIPCPLDVYRHLRFALTPEWDHYLHRATLVRQPFVCPVCSLPVSTRWALSEHAFAQHWGTLCFICCLFIWSDESITRGRTQKPLDATSTDGTIHQSSCRQSRTSTTAKSTVLNGHSNYSSLSPQIDAALSPPLFTNFWDHVHQCIEKRRAALKQASDHVDRPCGGSSDELIEIEPPRSDGSPHRIDTLQAILNWRMHPTTCAPTGSCSRYSVAKDTPIRNESHSPIVVVSSPQTASLGHDHPSSHSERTTITADDSDSTHSAFKRRRRLVIADFEDSEPERSHSRERNDAQCEGEFSNGLTVLHNRLLHKQPRLDSASSPPSSVVSEISDQKSVDQDGLISCILCGAQVTADTWEDHTLSHRNPHMPWSGVQLCEPRRIVLAQSQPKVYKCYICDHRFVTRFGCQRHVITRHKIAKSRIDWERLNDTTHSVSNSNVAVSNKSVMSDLVSLPKLKSKPSLHPSSSKIPSSNYLTSANGATRITDNYDNPPELHRSDQPVLCTVCRIPFLSERTMYIHRTAAHPNCT